MSNPRKVPDQEFNKILQELINEARTVEEKRTGLFKLVSKYDDLARALNNITRKDGKGVADASNNVAFVTVYMSILQKALDEVNPSDKKHVSKLLELVKKLQTKADSLIERVKVTMEIETVSTKRIMQVDTEDLKARNATDTDTTTKKVEAPTPQRSSSTHQATDKPPRPTKDLPKRAASAPTPKTAANQPQTAQTPPPSRKVSKTGSPYPERPAPQVSKTTGRPKPTGRPPAAPGPRHDSKFFNRDVNIPGSSPAASEDNTPKNNKKNSY